MRPRADPKVEFLNGLRLFAGCSEAELRDIAAVADETSFTAGKYLTIEGASGDELVLIVSGFASVIRHGEMVATLGPGDVVGEIALLTDRPRSASVIATSPITVLVIARPRFRALVDRFPAVRTRLDALAFLRDAS